MSDTRTTIDQAEFNVPQEHLPYARELATRLPYTEAELHTRVAQAVGMASACWENIAGAGVFDSTRAVAIHKGLVDDIIRLTGLGEPHLGCATNEEIAAEYVARLRGPGAGNPNYRTVD